MHTPDIVGWVKRSDIEIVNISIYSLIELSEFIVFDYGLSDTQDGIRCLRNRIYILWLTSSLCACADPGFFDRGGGGGGPGPTARKQF